MVLARGAMLDAVRKQLAVDMNCDPDAFIKDEVVFCEAAEGRRPFDRQTPYLEAATMGHGIVVSCEKDIQGIVQHQLKGKSREELFSAPLFYGHALYYIPESPFIKELPCPDGFSLQAAHGEQIHALYEYPEFHNALMYDPNHPRPDTLALYAVYGDEIAGVAGVSADCKSLWQIGIDVKIAYRGCGLAACLVSRLAMITMKLGIVPYYGTASSNIPSQAVAHRSGFAPVWMCTYKNTLSKDEV